MAKILIIEDENKIARFVELELKYEGYDVEIAGDGRVGLEKAIKNQADLILLDVMLPGINGIEVCRQIREHNLRVPIIMLTAKDDVMDKVAGLDTGADDYMTKPFAIEELLARIRVAINRTQDNGVKSEILQHNKLKVNLTSFSVTYDNEELSLTKKEYEVLEYLLQNKNAVITREELLKKVWEYEYMGDTNIVDVYVRYIRQKIDERFDIHLINTVRGVGYIIKDE